VIDSTQIFKNLEDDEKADYPDKPGIKEVFINAHLKELDGEEWSYNEGCLSIPKIREDIVRNEMVTLEFLNEQFQPITQSFSGVTARVILHEYDHIEGKLFIDYLKPLKRKLLKGKLEDISKGKVSVDYKMSFPKT
jgi:peptide deformylase